MGIAPKRHPVDPEKSNRALGFPALVTGLYQSYRVLVPPRQGHIIIGIHLQDTQWTRRSPTGSWSCQALITGLCQFYRVPVTSSKGIMPPTDRAFIKKYCVPRQAQGETPQQHWDGRGENTKTFSSLTSYPELRRSEFLIGGYVGARASLLSTTPPFVAMTQELVARGDTLRLSAPRHSVTPSVIDEQRPMWSSAPFPEMSAFSDGDISSLTSYPELQAAGPMIRGDTLRLSAPFCHPEAAGPMTSRDQVWSFCTLVSSGGGGPDDTRRYLTVIRTLLSSRGGGPNDKQRPKAAVPMIRGDTLRLFAPFCHPEAAGPMTSRDQVWSFCTLVSSRGGGPDDTRRYLTVIRTLLSSRGGGPDDKQRPKAAGPMIRGDTLRLSAPFCHPEAAGPMTSRDQVWSFCTLVSSRGGGPDDTRRYLTVIRTLLSSRGGGPDDTRRYLTVIRTLLSSRGGGPDDKQRPKAAGPMIRGDTLRLFAPFCHPEAAGPMTSRDQVWSFFTLVSSRGGGPDDTRRYLKVIRTLLSSRGGGPDDKQRPKAAGPMIRGDTLRLSAPFCHPEAAGPMTSRDQVWSFCTLVSSRGGGPDDTRKYPSGPLGPSGIFLQKAVASGGSNPARLGELSSPGRAGRQPPPLFCYK
ncbi:hypothetical protein HKD37_16G045283 [Glycine soja]